jgi:two-component system, NarL family, response regulator
MGNQMTTQDEDVHGLTDRETEVLTQASYGLRNQDIASELGISEKTVQAHMRHVLLKLGVRSRTHAVAEALRRGRLGTEA